MEWLAARPSEGAVVVASYRLKGDLDKAGDLTTDEGRAAIRGKVADMIYAPSDEDLRAGKGTRFARAMLDADDEEMEKVPKLAPEKVNVLALRAGSVMLDVMIDAHSWQGKGVRACQRDHLGFAFQREFRL